jgi:phosphopantetheinyl transferase
MVDMTRSDSAWVHEMFAKDTGAVWRSGTGVPPADHAQDARATFNLYQYFSARARDITPAAARDAACVLYAPFSSDLETSKHCASVLSADERVRSNRFATEELKTHFQQRRAFRRYCGALALGSGSSLSQITFAETENGRPYLRDRSDLWFSFSSCRSGFVGAWSSTHGLGVDLEDGAVELEVADLAQTYFTKSEARTVREQGPARIQTFLQLWSLKEAALKSIGQGLPLGLDAFEFALDESPRVLDAPADHGPERFTAHLFAQADVCAALVLRIL